MSTKIFRLKVNHDNGAVTFKTAASDEQQARQIICKAEGCPDGAIQWVKEVKPRKVRKTALKAARELGFETPTQYFDYMVESYVNGQRQQCRDLFNTLKKEDQKNALHYIRDNYDNKKIYCFYFNLL